jgi:hypothetical protein
MSGSRSRRKVTDVSFDIVPTFRCATVTAPP